MSMPQSVIKIKSNKNGVTVELTDSIDQTKWTIQQLIQRANVDVGRYLTRIIRKKVKAISNFTRKARYVPMRYQYWARKKEGDLQIGVENTSKGAVSAWWADQSELGTNGQPKRGFIRETVYENIDTIRDIQGQYLSAISDAQKAKKLAQEAENRQDEADEMADE